METSGRLFCIKTAGSMCACNIDAVDGILKFSETKIAAKTEALRGLQCMLVIKIPVRSCEDEQ